MANRGKKALSILFSSTTRQIVALIASFVSRTVFIYVLGADYLGLNGLFTNILSILSLADLGIGSAMVFHLYKPLSENDEDRIVSLLGFYKVCYRVIGLTILALGLCAMPLLPFLVNFDQPLPVNLYLVYFLFLANVCASYLMYAYLQMVLIANQEQYVIDRISACSLVVGLILDVVVLILFRSYMLYLICKVVLTFAKNIAVALITRHRHPYLRKDEKKLTRGEIRMFFADAGNTALFKGGNVMFNATDNIIISIILGTSIVGYYSNYAMIFTQANALISLVVLSLMAGIGNTIATENKEKQFALFKELDLGLYLCVSMIALCLLTSINTFINIWVGDIDHAYVLPQMAVIFMCMNFYLDGIIQISNTFREASGHFKTARSLQFMGGLVNVVLSVILGVSFGLVGIILATVIAKAFVTAIPFVIAVGNNVFDGRGKNFAMVLIRRFLGVALLGAICLLLCQWIPGNDILSLIARILLTISLALVTFLATYFRNPSFKRLLTRIKLLREEASKGPGNSR